MGPLLCTAPRDSWVCDGPPAGTHSLSSDSGLLGVPHTLSLPAACIAVGWPCGSASCRGHDKGWGSPSWEQEEPGPLSCCPAGPRRAHGIESPRGAFLSGNGWPAFRGAMVPGWVSWGLPVCCLLPCQPVLGSLSPPGLAYLLSSIFLQSQPLLPGAQMPPGPRDAPAGSICRAPAWASRGHSLCPELLVKGEGAGRGAGMLAGLTHPQPTARAAPGQEAALAWCCSWQCHSRLPRHGRARPTPTSAHDSGCWLARTEADRVVTKPEVFINTGNSHPAHIPRPSPGLPVWVPWCHDTCALRLGCPALPWPGVC